MKNSKGHSCYFVSCLLAVFVCIHAKRGCRHLDINNRCHNYSTGNDDRVHMTNYYLVPAIIVKCNVDKCVV